MRIAPTTIKSKITRFLDIRKYEKEQKFLNKYCNISNDLEGDTFTQLHTARKTIANYAKSKGVTVEFADAERKMLGEQFEWDISEKYAKKIAKDHLSITVKPLKRNGIVSSIGAYAHKDTSKTHLHTVNDYFVVEIPEDGLQQTRLTKHE